MTRAEKEEKVPYETHRTKYLKFVIVRFKPKTMVIAVVNLKSGEELGIIEWFSKWRQYCFMPYGSTVWNINCLQDIQNFITAIMIPHKPKPKTIGVVCQSVQDFYDFTRQKKFKKGIRNHRRRFVVGTTTYVCFSMMNHCIGYSLDKIIETDRAYLNQHYNKIMLMTKPYLKSN